MKGPLETSVLPPTYKTGPEWVIPAEQYGRSIDRFPPASGTGGGAPVLITFPFQLVKADATHIFVRYGTLQDVEPTNCETNIDVSGTNGTWTFYLDLEIDLNGAFVAATLSEATTGQPADADYHGYITLGTATVASSVITGYAQAATHSLRYAMCGRVVTGGSLTTRGTYEFWGF